MFNVYIISNQFTDVKTAISNPVLERTYFECNDFDNLIRLPVDVKKFKFFAYIILIIKILHIRLCGNKEDKYHVHFGGLTSFIVCLLVPFNNFYVTFHGTDLHGGSNPKSFKTIMNVFFSRFSAYNAKKISVVSNSLKHYLPDKIHHKVVVIPPGVNIDKFYPINSNTYRKFFGFNSESIIILFSDISKSRVKRIDIAKSVVSNLNKYCPDGKDYVLLHLCEVKQDDVPKYISVSDFILIVSDNEGSPNIVKESIAMEKPIASVNVGDIWDYLGPSDLKLKSNDVQYITNSILKKDFSFRRPGPISRYDVDIKETRKKYIDFYNF